MKLGEGEHPVSKMALKDMKLEALFCNSETYPRIVRQMLIKRSAPHPATA